MINVMIRTARGEHLEYKYTASEGVTETTDGAMNFAIEEYIANKLGGFSSTLFPVSEELWMTKIKTAVEEVDSISIQDKIELLNSICRNSTLKINKIFVGYSIKYPPTQLMAPVVIIDHDTGAVSWAAIENATCYSYSIDDVEQTTNNTSIDATSFSDGAVFKIKAVGNGAEYLDSNVVEITYDTVVE